MTPGKAVAKSAANLLVFWVGYMLFSILEEKIPQALHRPPDFFTSIMAGVPTMFVIVFGWWMVNRIYPEQSTRRKV